MKENEERRERDMNREITKLRKKCILKHENFQLSFYQPAIPDMNLIKRR